MNVYLVERLFGLSEILEVYMTKELAEEKCRKLTISTGDAWVVRVCPIYLDNHKDSSHALTDIPKALNGWYDEN